MMAQKTAGTASENANNATLSRHEPGRKVDSKALHQRQILRIFKRQVSLVRTFGFATAACFVPVVNLGRSWSPAISIAQYVRPVVALFALATPTREAPCKRRFLRCPAESIHWLSVFGKLS